MWEFLLELPVWIKMKETFLIYTLEDEHGTYKSPIWKGKWSEPNLHDSVQAVNLQGCIHSNWYYLGCTCGQLENPKISTAVSTAATSGSIGKPGMDWSNYQPYTSSRILLKTKGWSFFRFKACLMFVQFSVWNAEDSSETRLLVTCWLQESEKISVSQCFGSMTYHIPLVILYIHRLFLSACSHPWWFNSSPAARDQKESFEGWRSPLGVWERNLLFLFVNHGVCTFNLRCLGINFISERLNIFHLFKIPLVGKMVLKFLSPFPTFWMPTLRWLLLIAPFTGGRDCLGSRRTGQSCTCGAGADLNLGMKRWGQMKMRDQTLQFFWYVDIWRSCLDDLSVVSRI